MSNDPTTGSPTDKHGLIALRSVRHELAEHLKIARSYTHFVMVRPPNSPKDGVGTAVAFRLGQRLFLITAGHNLNGNFMIWLYAGDRRSIQAEVLNHHMHPLSLDEYARVDIGFVEIKDIPSLTACHIEQLHIGPPTPPKTEHETLLQVVGCPESAYERLGQDRKVGLMAVGGWLRGGDEQVMEVSLESEGHSMDPNGETFGPGQFPESPHGFSGGGIWTLVATKEGEIFDPRKHVKMSGTQYGWSKCRRMMLAMRPRFTVPYFFHCDPELQGEFGYVLDAIK